MESCWSTNSFNTSIKSALQLVGIERLKKELGNVYRVWLTGDMTRGLDTPIIDIALSGKGIDRNYLAKLTEKAEKLLEKKIRTIIYNDSKRTFPNRDYGFLGMY